MSGQPRLLFAHAIGNVQIHEGTDGQVSIQAQRHGLRDWIHLHYQQTGDAILITADIASDPLKATWVDFVGRVPR